MQRRYINGKARPIDHPCGRCVNCLINRREEHATKVVYEAKYSFALHFITLTYIDEILKELINDGTQLEVKRHVKLFLKRLRKAVWSKYKVRFRLTGNFEYGEINGRPHFHILFFNVPMRWEDFAILCNDLWSYGRVDVQPADGGKSLGNYLAKHTANTSLNKGDVLGFGVKPYRFSSKHLGEKYIDIYAEWQNNDLSRNYVPDPSGGGRYMRMPVSWKKKLYSDADLHLVNIKSRLKSESLDSALSLDEQRLKAQNVYSDYFEQCRKREALRQFKKGNRL